MFKKLFLTAAAISAVCATFSLNVSAAGNVLSVDAYVNDVKTNTVYNGDEVELVFTLKDFAEGAFNSGQISLYYDSSVLELAKYEPADEDWDNYIFWGETSDEVDSCIWRSPLAAEDYITYEPNYGDATPWFADGCIKMSFRNTLLADIGSDGVEFFRMKFNVIDSTEVENAIVRFSLNTDGETDGIPHYYDDADIPKPGIGFAVFNSDTSASEWITVNDDFAVITANTKPAAPENVLWAMDSANPDAKYKTLATWSEVDARGYEVKLVKDGADKTDFIPADEAEYNFAEEMTKGGVYKFVVRAKGENGIYSDEVESDTVTVTLELDKPENLAWNETDKTVTWDAVDNADGYTVTVYNGTEVVTTIPVDTNSADLTKVIEELSGEYTVTVVATDSTNEYDNSLESEAVTINAYSYITGYFSVDTLSGTTVRNKYFINVTLKNANNEYTGVDEDGDGFIAFSNVKPGTYTVTVSKKGTKTREITGFVVNDGVAGILSTESKPINLFPGDVDGDGNVNSLDTSLLTAIYGEKEGEAIYDKYPWADFCYASSGADNNTFGGDEVSLVIMNFDKRYTAWVWPN